MITEAQENLLSSRRSLHDLSDFKLHSRCLPRPRSQLKSRLTLALSTVTPFTFVTVLRSKVITLKIGYDGQGLSESFLQESDESFSGLLLLSGKVDDTAGSSEGSGHGRIVGSRTSSLQQSHVGHFIGT